MFSQDFIFLTNQLVPNLDCDDLAVSKKEAYIDELSEDKRGFLMCWCEK